MGGGPQMVLVEASKLALQSLWANKLRSVLTLLGVVIGVASVIMVVTLTNGAKQFVTSKLNRYGASVITITKTPQAFITVEEFLEFQKRRDITMEDYRAVLSDCHSCVTVGARRELPGKVVYGRNSTTDTFIRGWTWTMPGLSNLDLEYGRAFTGTGRRAQRTHSDRGRGHCEQHAGSG
jgi:putative ABC transport system permease protein